MERACREKSLLMSLKYANSETENFVKHRYNRLNTLNTLNVMLAALFGGPLLRNGGPLLCLTYKGTSMKKNILCVIMEQIK